MSTCLTLTRRVIVVLTEQAVKMYLGMPVFTEAHRPARTCQSYSGIVISNSRILTSVHSITYQTKPIASKFQLLWRSELPPSMSRN